MVDNIQVFTIEDVFSTRSYARRNSPCSRRKYGAMIITKDGNHHWGANVRVGKYCSDGLCVRNYKNVPHASNVELGGEIHAEQALLTDVGRAVASESHLMVAGVGHDDKNLFGWDNIPCHVCAMSIKYAGIKNVWLPYVGGPYPHSIDEILEYYERFD